MTETYFFRSFLLLHKMTQLTWTNIKIAVGTAFWNRAFWSISKRKFVASIEQTNKTILFRRALHIFLNSE